MTDSYQAVYDAVRSRIGNADIGSAVERAFNDARPGHRRQTVLAPERRIDGKARRVPMSMGEFREAVQARPQEFDLFDLGGCGCFLEDAA